MEVSPLCFVVYAHGHMKFYANFQSTVQSNLLGSGFHYLGGKPRRKVQKNRQRDR